MLLLILERDVFSVSIYLFVQCPFTYKNTTFYLTRWSRGYHTRHWIRGSRVQTQPGSMDFSERKNLEYDVLRKGSKAMGPVS